MRYDIGTVRCDIAILRWQIGTMRCDIGTVRCDIAILRWQIGTVRCDIGIVRCDIAILTSIDVNLASREAILVVGDALSRVHSVNCVSKVKHLSNNTAFDRNSRSDAKAVSYFRTARIDIVPIYCMEAGMFFVILFNKQEGSQRVS